MRAAFRRHLVRCSFVLCADNRTLSLSLPLLLSSLETYLIRGGNLTPIKPSNEKNVLEERAANLPTCSTYYIIISSILSVLRSDSSLLANGRIKSPRPPRSLV